MCKAKGQGKRCPATPQRKELESYRQKVKYYASKEMLSSAEWLDTEDGKLFEELYNPKLNNPLWEEEHQANLEILRNQCRPQNEFPDSLKEMKEKFLEPHEVRGDSTVSLMNSSEYYAFVAEQLPDLPEGHRKAIVDYTMISHSGVNKLLLSQRQDMNDYDYAEEIYAQSITNIEQVKIEDNERREQIKELDSALSNRIREQELTYRCVSAKETAKSILYKYKPNSIVTFDGFTSTSHSPSVAMEFSDMNAVTRNNEITYERHDGEQSIIFEIQSNAGLCIAPYSHMEIEKEVLLPRGLHFKVVHTYQATKDTPYQVRNPYVLPLGDKRIGSAEKDLIIIQLIECDKDGNILPPDYDIPHHPSKLIPSPLQEKNKAS